jgi:hypothetical protein
MALDFGTIELNTGDTLKPVCTFASDLATAGTGVTITGTPTVSAVRCTASYVSHTTGGPVTISVSGVRADEVGEVTVSAAYTNGETQTGVLYVTPG